MLAGGGGAIVNTSSNAGLRGIHLLGAYVASKHGIVGLTKTAAIEYANDGIRVNAVCPGAIMTPLMSDQPPERQQEILSPQAMDRFGDPAEVAAAVVWLCSDDASFVTGVVDAGRRRLGRRVVDQLDLLRTMWRIRVFEERVGELKRADEVYGLMHLSVGQEGVAAGVCGQLRADDPVYSGHRAHGHAIAKGAPLDAVMAELMGRDGGLCRGLGGSMHLVDVEHGLLGATGVVGGNVPMALGSALAARLTGGDQVAVVFFGDGAVQAGHWAESANLAALWELPVVLVCENNGFAEFTPRSAHTKVERVSDLVAPYGITRETVDGNDVVAVRDAFAGFLAAARTGAGPFLLECLTYRLRGHYEGDPGAYREAISKADWQLKDPILRFQRRGVEEGWFGEDDAAAAERDAREAVDEAVRAARESPAPAPGLMAELTYADAPPAPAPRAAAARARRRGRRRT